MFDTTQRRVLICSAGAILVLAIGMATLGSPRTAAKHSDDQHFAAYTSWSEETAVIESLTRNGGLSVVDIRSPAWRAALDARSFRLIAAASSPSPENLLQDALADDENFIQSIDRTAIMKPDAWETMQRYKRAAKLAAAIQNSAGHETLSQHANRLSDDIEQILSSQQQDQM